MNYSYVLLSERDGKFYIGSTGNLRERLQKHNSGGVRSTAYRRPLRLIYYEARSSLLACWLAEIHSSKLERC